MSNKRLFQHLLNDNGGSLRIDGDIREKTITEFYKQITNTRAPAITNVETVAIADELGVSTKQVHAVSIVESNGGGFTNTGRPKILFERHKFHELTGGIHSVTPFSDRIYGGYNVDSWLKLERALAVDPIAALQSCSWGKFQIMGFHASGSSIRGSLNLGYRDVLDMVTRMSRSEFEHYIALARFIKAANLTTAMRRIGTNPDDNRAFVRGYNGQAGIERNNYHVKIAKAMT